MNRLLDGIPSGLSSPRDIGGTTLLFNHGSGRRPATTRGSARTFRSLTVLKRDRKSSATDSILFAASPRVMAHRVIYTFQGSPHLSPSLHQKAIRAPLRNPCLGGTPFDASNLTSSSSCCIAPCRLFRCCAGAREAPDRGGDFRARAAHRRAARRAHVVAGRKAPDLSGWRTTDGCGCRDGQGARAGERGQDGSLDGGSDSERDRDHRERYNMASYMWAPDSAHLLFDSNGQLWLYDLRNGMGVQIGLTGALPATIRNFRPMVHPSRLSAITVWP